MPRNDDDEAFRTVFRSVQTLLDSRPVTDAEQAALDVAEIDAEGWAYWHGGPPPQEHGLRVDVLLRNGAQRFGMVSDFWWGRMDDDTPLPTAVGRRFVKPQEFDRAREIVAWKDNATWKPAGHDQLDSPKTVRFSFIA